MLHCCKQQPYTRDGAERGDCYKCPSPKEGTAINAPRRGHHLQEQSASKERGDSNAAGAVSSGQATRLEKRGLLQCPSPKEGTAINAPLRGQHQVKAMKEGTAMMPLAVFKKKNPGQAYTQPCIPSHETSLECTAAFVCRKTAVSRQGV